MKWFGAPIVNLRIWHKGVMGHWIYRENWPNPDYQKDGKGVAPAYIFIADESRSNGGMMIIDYIKE